MTTDVVQQKIREIYNEYGRQFFPLKEEKAELMGWLRSKPSIVEIPKEEKRAKRRVDSLDKKNREVRGRKKGADFKNSSSGEIGCRNARGS